jgi:glucoamylase
MTVGGLLGPAGRWRRVPLLLAALALVAAGGVVQVQRSRHVRVPLLSDVVIDQAGARVPGPPMPAVRDAYGTHVVAPADLAGRARQQRDWLGAGWRPAEGGRYHRLVTDALLDLDTLLLPNGASVAGWPGPWRYVWPRDASFAAVALAQTGHTGDARAILAFLQRVQAPDGAFQARYQPDGSGVPDARGEESDGPGWALWALREAVTSLPEGQRAAVLAPLTPLLDRSERRLLDLTEHGDHLPPASLDYWEVRDDRLTLGTAASAALGLREAATLRTLSGRPGDAAADAARAEQVAQAVRDRFGPRGYQRYLPLDGHDRADGGDPGDGGGVDAALTFLLPPFTPTCDATVLSVWRGAADRMRRPAGGLAPGEGWKDDGISWTPETALFALAAAATGDRPTAERYLAWLQAHTTAHGALPEKVLSDGAPAGPAPLAWTSALVVITAHELEAPTRPCQ